MNSQRCKVVVPGILQPEFLSEHVAIKKAKQRCGTRVYDAQGVVIFTASQADEDVYKASLSKR